MGVSARNIVAFALVCVSAVVHAQSAEVRRLVSQLGSDDEAARIEARQLLPRAGVSGAEFALPLLRDDREANRRAAFNTIRDIAHEAASPGRDGDRASITNTLALLLAPVESPRTRKLALRLLAVSAPEDWDTAPVAVLLDRTALREEARRTLQSIDSRHAANALRTAADTAGPRFRVALLGALGAMHAKPKRGIESFMNSGNERVRLAALRALAKDGSPALLTASASVLERASANTRDDVFDVQLRHADAMMDCGGNWDAAIAQYELVFKAAEASALKGAALAGLARFGDESAAELVMDAVAGKHGNDVIPAALSALATLQGKAAHDRVVQRYDVMPDSMRPLLLTVLGQTRDADYLVLLEREFSARNETVQNAARAAWKIATASDEPGSRFRPAPDVPFIGEWHLVGPFPWDPESGFANSPVSAPNIDLNARYTGLPWEKITVSEDGGIVNLMGHLAPAERVTAYAYTTITAVEATEAILWLGSDDGIKVWLNGEAVHENLVDRGLKADNDRVPVELRAGDNALLVQITQGGGGWAFCARISTTEGEALGE